MKHTSQIIGGIIMTNREFKELLANIDQEELVELNNGLTLIVSRTDMPVWVTLSINYKDSVTQRTRIRKAVYRKVKRFCANSHMKWCCSMEWDNHFIRIIVESNRDWNRLVNLFQFLNGRRLAKTVRNNNPYCVK